MSSLFDDKKVLVSDSLRFFERWLDIALDNVERDATLETLETVLQVNDALSAAFGTYHRRVQELGIVMGLEHELVRFAESCEGYATAQAKGRALMQKFVAREKRRAYSAITAQAGHWLSP